jgi:tetratricopeptide (TPR) repeat protein
MSGKGFCLYVVGRLRGLTRQRLAELVERAGGRVASKPSSRVDLVAVGHSAVGPTLPDVPPLLRLGDLPAATRTISENGLKRTLGLAPPLPAEHRTLAAAEIAQGARLDLDVVRCLALFDVLEPLEERYSYRDLLAASEVARGLRKGLTLHAIVRASFALRESGRSLSDTRLSEAPWGEVLQSVAGRPGNLKGQFTLPLDEAFESADVLFERGEDAEMAGDLAGAERCYGLAMRVDRTDPVIPFNLGNVLDAAGRRGEATFAYQQAISRDATFAEAWLNLGAVREGMDRIAEAIRCYRRALHARPDYPEALHNLAALLTRRGGYGEALPLWERYLALPHSSDHAPGAKRLSALCRLELAKVARGLERTE